MTKSEIKKVASQVKKICENAGALLYTSWLPRRSTRINSYTGEGGAKSCGNPILLCGLQGAGKTTTAGKLARLLVSQGKKVAVTSVDATRPAAREQLQILAGQVDVPYLVGEGSSAAKMASSALKQAKT